MVKSKKTKIISIIGGTGAMGQMFARVFMLKGYEVLIAGRKTKLRPKEAAKRGDLVIICVPISMTEKVIKEIAPFVRREAILSDFTSVKTMPNEIMRASSKGQIVGAHPIFGPIADLTGQPLVVCPERISKAALTWYKNLFKSLGLKVIEMSAQDHDKQMAVVQCLNHLSNLVFANTIKDLKFDLINRELFSPAFILKLNLIKRMLSQSSALYAEIETYNPYAKLMSDRYRESLEEIKKEIDRGDEKALESKILDIQRYFLILNKDQNTLAEIVPDLKEKVSTTKDRIAILGPLYSHSHLLAKNIYSKNDFLLCDSIEEVFKSVDSGQISHGLVPIENMLNGSVRECIIALKKYQIKINHLYHFPIHHCFASKTTKFTKIISHPQAIAQCSKYLADYRKKGVEIVETTSTSKALEIASIDQTYAAIGSVEGAKYFGLEILKRDIENNHHNVTSFIVISKKENQSKLSKNVRTSILITPNKDHPGLLYEVLSSFKKYNINLTKIESIPTGEKIGEYIFYIEFDGNLNQTQTQSIIDLIKALFPVYVLGSYEVKQIIC